MSREAFIRRIAEAPDDDTPRLVYADWLDEHGDPDRAEFIRVQCELAKRPYRDFFAADYWGGQLDEPEDMKALNRLRKREAELTRAHARIAAGTPGKDELTARWIRGFVVSVRGPLAVLLEHLPGLGPELALVETVAVTDREPFGFQVRSAWWKKLPRHADESAAVPADLWRLLTGFLLYGSGTPSVLKWYPTRDAAHAALSATVLAACRDPGSRARRVTPCYTTAC